MDILRAPGVSGELAEPVPPARRAAYRWIMEVYRSRNGRWVVERHLDRYLIYDLDWSPRDEVWSCRTLDQLYRWLAERGLDPADFDETA